MSYSYSPYNSSLDSLVFDVPVESSHSENEAAADLALWTNAQFTFDVKPGVGIYDDEKKQNVSSTPLSVYSAVTNQSGVTGQCDNDLEPITYEKLVNYLDFELPQQQEIQSAVCSPSPRSLAPAPPASSRQLLLPKPPVADASHLTHWLTQPIPGQQQPKKSLSKRARDSSDDHIVASEDDKRRRNTAASARFRIKKKMREQAMEQTVRDMTTKSEALQSRVNELELEVKWLRGLLIDKDVIKAKQPSTA
ncbi:hypothetical protein DFQ28_005180 [Apophysomyces sp. BC1034]|nr:hypothetical protein DFQ30_006170 [Apophysomyces sp. BC1015]KAG0177660.1 hypothetical protein DFQ29_004556 [Apophysomyces sp. BC1021]KAG0188248.1 hypothetical protein DFQ28_005180 [Apophysomyces sp. BC1034]